MLPTLIFTVGVFALVCISAVAAARILGRKKLFWKHAVLFSLLVFFTFGFFSATPLGRIKLGQIDLKTIVLWPLWLLIGNIIFARYARSSAGELLAGRDALKLAFVSLLIAAGIAALGGAIYVALSVQ